MDPGTITQPGDNSGFREKVSIASQYDHCKNSFYKLLENTETSNDKTIAQRLLNEFGRFKVWAGNVGAHRTGRVSLDYRLREASHIHNELTHLLGQLSKTLDKGEFVFFPWCF